jgi:hypothetical protein
MAFDFAKWAKCLPTPAASQLDDEGFNTLASLTMADITDLKAIHLKPGHFVVVREAVKVLQEEHGGGPLTESVKAATADATAGDRLAELLGSLAVSPQPNATTASGGDGTCYRIVDFVPSIVGEEEVSIGGGVSLKMTAKPKLDKVSPGLWIAANAKILARLMGDKDFDVGAYVKYTEMVGELAARFTWASVMIFDDEYRQRQAREKFPWGRDAPHLSTITLRDRPPQQQQQQGKKGQGGGNRRAVGPSGKEVCIQFNRGQCSFGDKCHYEHVCSICSKDHSARNHPTTTATKTE